MKRLLILSCALLLSACISSSDDNDASGPPGSNRANQWVRSNAMFVAGLNVSMGAPPAGFVNNYKTLIRFTLLLMCYSDMPSFRFRWVILWKVPFKVRFSTLRLKCLNSHCLCSVFY